MGKKVKLNTSHIELNFLRELNLNNSYHIKNLFEILNLYFYILYKSTHFNKDFLDLSDIETDFTINDIINYKIYTFNPHDKKLADELYSIVKKIFSLLIASNYIQFEDNHVQQEINYKKVLIKMKTSNLEIEEYHPKIEKFEKYLLNTLKDYKSLNNYMDMYGGINGYFPQKVFEHWISAEYLQWTPSSRVLDIAAWISPATDILAKYLPADFYKHDITYKTDLSKKTISGFANSIESPDQFFDFVIAHCAIDNFEGESDIQLFNELNRILKPEGKVLITPLHMSSFFENKVAIGSPGLFVDASARIVIGDMSSLRFGRLYSVETLIERIITKYKGIFHFKIIKVNNLPIDKYKPTCTNRFMLLAEKL